ncbi:Protein transport protein Sec24C [Dermatophagoides farinae]|uniref:Protein transport protein Sec24C n=2 Tax=Dermatophagoides farinae TaxID=6954 RepID=A0A922I6U0_DERFA|nr:protein transport protein Sec24C-like [Dermatophagoides farinae]KAH9526477.1 Protein transport protein Sec24C [Dermatophagoides farinae]
MDPQVRQTNPPMMMNYPQPTQWTQQQQQQPMSPNQQYYHQQQYQQQQFVDNSCSGPPPPPPPSLPPQSNTMVAKSQSGDHTGSLTNQMTNLSLNNGQPLQQNDTLKSSLQNGQNVSSSSSLPSYTNQYPTPNSGATYADSQMPPPPTMAPNSLNYINQPSKQQEFQHQPPPPQSAVAAAVPGNWNQNPIKTTIQQQQQPVVPSLQPPTSSAATGYQSNNAYDGQPQQQQNGSLPLQPNYPQPSQNMYQQPNSYQPPQQPPMGGGHQQSMASMNHQYGSPYGMPTNRYGSTPTSPTGYGSMNPSQSPFNQQPQQAQNKLDPDAMPSVVQVILEDKTKYETNSPVLFTTAIPASVPPLVTTVMENGNQIIQDGGCASPLFVRPTIYQVPISEDIIKTTDIPFGMLIKPFDEQEVDRKIYVPISPSEIVRCNRCKAYMNPYNRFIDGGRRFQCSLCHHVTEVPQTYFANLDHTGQRLDRQQRPELCLGSYEFLATEEYCHNGVQNNRRPHLIFACELTETSKPILNILAANLVNIIKNFPRDSGNPESLPPMFGFLTYNSKIQIYDIVNNGHAHVICDLTTPFAPLNTFLVDPLIHMDKIEKFFEQLPQLYANEEMDMQTILGPVIEAALMSTQVDVNNWINKNIVNKVVNTGNQQSNDSIPVGKIYLFHSTLPTYGSDSDTPGRLKQKWTNSVDELRKLLGSDKEKTILSPLTNKYYIELGQKCVADYATGVELFLFPPLNGFLDVAILGELTRLSGTGSIFKFYNDFSDAFLIDLKYSLSSSFAFECVLKIRTSTGIRPNDYYGYFYSRSPSDVECAAINTTTNISVEFKYDDKLTEDEHVVIQSAILYTSLSGQRRVRIHNIALASCTQIGDLYRNACCDSIVNILARIAVNQLRNGDKTIQQTKEAIVSRVINILTAYRKHCAQPGTSLGQLILPEALKILPMYICGLLKCDAIDGGPEISPDDKAYAQLKLLGSFISSSQVFLYPKLYRIEYESESETDTLKYSQIRCSAYKLTSAALAYVLENGFYVMLYITSNGCNNVKFLNGLFGPNVDSATKIKMELPLPNLLTNESQFMHRLFKKMETERKCSYKIFIIRQGIDKTETVFRSFLYEDQKIVTRQAADSKLEGLSYVDLLCHLHKEIRVQLN